MREIKEQISRIVPSSLFMESTPYALPVRHAWWTNSTAEVEKENRPHQISLLELQSHAPLDPICLQSCMSEPPCIHRADCTDSQIEVNVDAIKGSEKYEQLFVFCRFA